MMQNKALLGTRHKWRAPRALTLGPQRNEMDAYKIILGRNPGIGASIPTLYRRVFPTNYRLRPSISDMGNHYGRILDRRYCHYD